MRSQLGVRLHSRSFMQLSKSSPQVRLNGPGTQTNATETTEWCGIVHKQPDGTEQKKVVGFKKCIHFILISYINQSSISAY